MRRLLLGLVSVMALAVPLVASAKEQVTAVTVCGAKGCASAGDLDLRGRAAAVSEFGSAAPPRAGAYYRFKLAFDGTNQGPSAFYVRERNLVASRAETAWTAWAHPSAELTRILRRLSAQVAPFPTPRLMSVWVGARNVSSDPNSYLRLFALDSTPTVPPRGERRSIWFAADRANPWSTRIAYYPADHVVEVAPGRFVRLPDAVARDLAAARPLTGERSSGVAWRLPATIGSAAAFALLAVAAALLFRRRTGRFALPRLGGLSGKSAS